jgi:predicted N-formylglutamate amidohydrolase
MDLLWEHGFVVGNNEPYDGAMEGDCLSRNVTSRGLPSVMIEIRHDLLATPTMAQEFADRLYPVLDAALAKMGRELQPRRAARG